MGFIIALIAVLAAAFTFLGFYLRYRTYNSLYSDIKSGNLDHFFSHIDGFCSKTFLSVFAHERLKFLALAEKGDKELMVQQFNSLMKLKLSDATRAEVLSDGFNAFIGIGDKKHAKRILKEIESSSMSERQRGAYRRHFDIVFDGKAPKYRKDLESAYATLSGARRGYVAYLLSFSFPGDERRREYRVEASRLTNVPEDQLDRRIHVNTTV